MNISLIAIAVLPVLVLAFVVYRQDKYEKEPIGKLIKAFIFGALAILPAVLLEGMLSRFVPPIPVVSGAYMGFVVAGCSEELCKNTAPVYISGKKYVSPRDLCKPHIDYIIFLKIDLGR